MRFPIEITFRGVEPSEAVETRIRALAEKLDTVHNVKAELVGRVPLEASGGITLDSVRAIAETGVERISIGALTHSVRALDISMRI